MFRALVEARLPDRAFGATFGPTMLQLDPIARFTDAYVRAAASEPFDASRAALATCDARGVPSVRFVLVKEFGPEGFNVYTNLESRKARDVQQNPRASLAFHWFTTGEQVRIEGPVRPVPDAVADAYFAARPRGSQLGAWASAQSRPIASREELSARVAELDARYQGQSVPRPPFWGGFAVVPESVEFWHDQPDRLHDRFLYTRGGSSSSRWDVVRLSP